MFLQKEAFTTAWGKRVMVLTSTHHRTKHIYWNKSGRENLYFIFYVLKLELADAEVIMTLLHRMKWSGEMDYHIGNSNGSVELVLRCRTGSTAPAAGCSRCLSPDFVHQQHGMPSPSLPPCMLNKGKVVQKMSVVQKILTLGS